MAKGAKKRQRTSEKTALGPLGNNEEPLLEKDLEEKRLENILFGTNHELGSDEEGPTDAGADMDDAGIALENMMDTDVPPFLRIIPSLNHP